MSNSKGFFTYLSATLAMLVLAGSLYAAPITINSVTGSWSSVSGGRNLSGLGTDTVKWGWRNTPATNSAYQFIGTAPAVFPVNVGQEFNLGTFTHFNYVIPVNSGITGAQLSVKLSMTIGSTTINNLNFNYNFSHLETLNVPPCIGGSGSVCDDVVTLMNNDLFSDVFVVDGTQYTLKVLGFQVGSNQFTQFFTRENAANSAVLRAVITSSVHLPEPQTYLTLGSFLLLMVVYFRKKLRVSGLPQRALSALRGL